MGNLSVLFAVLLTLGVLGCGKKTDDAATGASAKNPVGGDVIRIDGSSTVFPITQLIAEDFEDAHGGRVTIGVSGTGGGFKKFCRGETVISGASRPIKAKEIEVCKKHGVAWIELPVAYDGLAVVVHKNNDWVDRMTVDELNKMWSPAAEGAVTKWSQVRAGWPDEAFHLFGPGLDSGTYDYFTAAIVGKEHSSRSDFSANEDDNVLVHGVSSDQQSLGFFGFAYYVENKAKLKAVPIDDNDADNGVGPVLPSVETVADGRYQPLSRPIFIYVSQGATKRPEVERFVEFYLDKGDTLVKEAGYIPLPDVAMDLTKKRFRNRTVGSMFAGGSKIGVTVEVLLLQGN